VDFTKDIFVKKGGWRGGRESLACAHWGALAAARRRPEVRASLRRLAMLSLNGGSGAASLPVALT